MPRTIAVANQKGGCGKTTLAVNLAAALALRGEHVLLIDLDPQGHASLGLGVNSESLEKTVCNVLDPGGGVAAMSDIVLHVTERLDLAPANVTLCAVEQTLSGRDGRELRLKKALAPLARSYDFIIIDCPPSLGLLTFNALIAADELLVPLEASSYALQGVSRLLETVALLETQAGHVLEYHIVFSLFDGKTRFARELAQQALDAHRGHVLHTRIRQTVKLKRAASRGRAVAHGRSRQSTAFRDFFSLACEVRNLKTLSTIHALQLDFSTQRFPLELSDGIYFALQAEQAADVHVVGDFNHWKVSDESRLMPDGSGGWRRFVPLKAGAAYQYKFLVDGRWVEDSSNPHRLPSPLGGYNSVISLEQGERA